MNSIIYFMFSSELGFPETREKEESLGKLSESVQQLCDELSKAQPELWKEYQKQVKSLQDQERWMEFERGFLLAVQFITEIMQRISRT